MLRAFLLYLSRAPWAKNLITRWGFSRRAAARFIAGETLDEALRAVAELNARGLFATLDHLGENVTTPAEARHAAEDYLEIIDRICASGVRSNASLKLSQLGLGLDDQLCLDNLRRILRKAAACGVFVRVDMEDSSTVDRALQIQRTLREKGLHNTGLVIQAYLFRSLADVQALLVSPTRIRLCKGAYREPPQVAFPRKADVNLNFDTLAAMMIDAALAHGSPPSSPDGRTPALPAIASHDEKRITFARRYAEQVRLPKAALEFQLLHGIRTDLQAALAQAGYPVRVYVPYGTHWYPYFMRRLAER
ncbi:MAG: proline dehydrogenase family protein, partial [Anaerolineales bacterium]|nr:proline dehydrogenase family protein [Anaerolineales bacterium]